MPDYYEYSVPELIGLLGERFRDYRLRYNLTQKDVAEQSGITVNTIHKFETGNAGNISLRTFLLLMKTIRRLDGIDDILPDVPLSPYLMKEEKKAQRVRHKKQ
jgi:transcriptional regulator with XRE-family HTH domain